MGRIGGTLGGHFGAVSGSTVGAFRGLEGASRRLIHALRHRRRAMGREGRTFREILRTFCRGCRAGRFLNRTASWDVAACRGGGRALGLAARTTCFLGWARRFALWTSCRNSGASSVGNRALGSDADLRTTGGFCGTGGHLARRANSLLDRAFGWRGILRAPGGFRGAFGCTLGALGGCRRAVSGTVGWTLGFFNRA